MVIGKVHLPLISACYQAYLQIYNLHDFKWSELLVSNLTSFERTIEQDLITLVVLSIELLSGSYA